MFTRAQLEHILFIDIETVSEARTFDALSPQFQQLWQRKSELLKEREGEPHTPEGMYTGRAAIYAEFGKVVCISCGFIKYQGDKPHFRLKSIHGTDEAALLREFATVANGWMSRSDRQVCAHNGKEFDFPYLGRRYLIQGLPLPGFLLELQSKKPWEVRVLDTMQIWKFGDYKSFTSLDLLCAVLGVPSPKEDMDGSMVGRVYWEEGDHAKIAAYCERDVLATAQVMLRMSGAPLIAEEDVAHA